MNNKSNDIHKQKLFELDQELFKYKKTIVEYTQYLDILKKHIRFDVNASVVRATVNREGSYNNYNIYTQIKNISLTKFDEIYYNIKERIKIYIKKLFNSSNDRLENALILSINYYIDNEYSNYLERDSGDYEKILYNLISNKVYWCEMKKILEKSKWKQV